MAIINVVQGDTAPQIRATLTRADTGLAEDDSGSTIKLHFRKTGTKNVLFSLDNLSSTDDQENGILYFEFSGNQLEIDAGTYEAEIETVFPSGTRETVYETITFILREDFA